jgi:hypothetical protein
MREREDGKCERSGVSVSGGEMESVKECGTKLKKGQRYSGKGGLGKKAGWTV